MSVTDQVPQTYEEAERLLARWQGEGGPEDLLIFTFPDPAEESVRLLGVSDEFMETGAVLPMSFGRSAELPFRSSTASVTPAEWDRIRAGRIALPAGWDLATARQVWP